MGNWYTYKTDKKFSLSITFYLLIILFVSMGIRLLCPNIEKLENNRKDDLRNKKNDTTEPDGIYFITFTLPHHIPFTNHKRIFNNLP